MCASFVSAQKFSKEEIRQAQLLKLLDDFNNKKSCGCKSNYRLTKSDAISLISGKKSSVLADSKLKTILNIGLPLEYNYQTTKTLVFLKHEIGIYSWDTKDLVIDLPKTKTSFWTWFFIGFALLIGLCVFFFLYYANKNFSCKEEEENDTVMFLYFLGFFILWILEFFVLLLFSPFSFLNWMGIMILFNIIAIVLSVLISYFVYTKTKVAN